MGEHNISEAADPKTEEVLRKSLIRTADKLQLTGQEVEQITGISASGFSRMKTKNEAILNGKKQEAALLLIRLYRSLAALAGPDNENINAWFNANNRHLDACPRELVKSTEGLCRVVQYLDAMRGRI